MEDPKRFDTMELKELHKMLKNVESEASGKFDLDTIIAEVNNEEPTETSAETETPKETTPEKPVEQVPKWIEIEPEEDTEEPEAAPPKKKERKTSGRHKFVFMEAKLGQDKQEKSQEKKVEPAKEMEGKSGEPNRTENREKPQFVFVEDKLGQTTAKIPEKETPVSEKSEEKPVSKPDRKPKYSFRFMEAQLGEKKDKTASENNSQNPVSDKPDLSATWTPERLAVLQERKEELRRRRALEGDIRRKKEQAYDKEAQDSPAGPKKKEAISEPIRFPVKEKGIKKETPPAATSDGDMQILQQENPSRYAKEKPKTQVKEVSGPDETVEKKTTGSKRRWLWIRNNRKPDGQQAAAEEKTGTEENEDLQGRNEIGDISKLDRVREEEEPPARDPRRATKTCGRRAKSLRVRSRLVLLFMLGAAYLTMGDVFNLPIPEKIAYTANPSLFLLMLVILEIFSMLVALDVVGVGLYRLFNKEPDLSTAVAAAMIGSLAHCIVMIVAPSTLGTMPFTAVHIAILYTAMRAEEHRASGKQAIYKAASLSENPVGIYCHNEDKKARMMTLKFRAQDMEAFLKDIEKPDTYEKVSRLYGPIVIVVSLVLALIVSIASGEKSRFLWAYSAILSMALSMGLLSAFGLPYKYVSRKMMREGVAIAGIRVAGLLSRAKRVVLTDGDLFPAGTVEIEGLRVFGRYTAERVLSYATAVIGGSGSTTYRVFAETLRERYGTPVRASNVLQYESGGLSADVQGNSVLVGCAAFMLRMGIPLREGQNIPNAVFVVVNNEVAGIFAMKYNPCAQSYAGIHTLLRNRKTPVLAARDFNIQPVLAEKCFDIKRGVLEYPELSRRSMISDRGYVEKDTLCAIMSRDDLAPYSDCIQAAGKLTRAITANLLLGLISGVLGILIMFFLTFTGAFLSATPLNVLLYLILWDIPVVFISRNTKKSY